MEVLEASAGRQGWCNRGLHWVELELEHSARPFLHRASVILGEVQTLVRVSFAVLSDMLEVTVTRRCGTWCERHPLLRFYPGTVLGRRGVRLTSCP